MLPRRNQRVNRSFGKRQPSDFGGVERRREVREKTDVIAQIVLPTGQTAKCSVIDYSNAGAGLVVASAFGLPETFELRAGVENIRLW
jgi:hypothetical protein